ncbi:hypothetical protein T492DRAFT_832931 [Pavlovales sp. CCMP2436]|nr:hypothetical protein T492DRAFT_832931 [Pavlovales sp. CCMP2436]
MGGERGKGHASVTRSLSPTFESAESGEGVAENGGAVEAEEGEGRKEPPEDEGGEGEEGVGGKGRDGEGGAGEEGGEGRKRALDGEGSSEDEGGDGPTVDDLLATIRVPEGLLHTEAGGADSDSWFRTPFPPLIPPFPPSSSASGADSDSWFRRAAL